MISLQSPMIKHFYTIECICNDC